MLQQAARHVRQQVARVATKSSTTSRQAANAVTLLRAPGAPAAAAAFHSAAAPLASAAASSQREEQSHSSSSAASASASFSSASLALLGALVGSVGGVWLLRANEVAAESAAAGMPDVSAAAAASSSPLDDAPRKKKKKGSKKRAKDALDEPRPKLSNPGKLSLFHNSITEVTNVHTWQGGQFTWVTQAWPQLEEHPAKQAMMQIMGNMGGPQGDTAQLFFMTQLGQNHTFDGVVDNGGGLQGSYQLAALNHRLSIKPSFQITPNGNGGELDVNYRANEWTLHFGLSPMQLDASLSIAHALTRNLAMGAELHVSGVGAPHLNGGLKYKNKLEMMAISKKDSTYQASYCREIFREDNVLFDVTSEVDPPPAVCSLAADLKLNPTSGKSDVTVAMKNVRHSFTYQASISTEPRVEVMVDMEPMPSAPIRLGFTMSKPFTGKAEDVTTCGVSITMQL